MTTKIKTALLTVFFIFGLLTGLQAQDKYDFAIVNYGWSGKIVLSVSINGSSYKETILGKDNVEGIVWWANMSPPLKQVSEMQQMGWELFSFSGSGSYTGGYTFLLRKKQ